eukprot:TRINITY_DN11855_c1_g1_i1.p1 TRINITY_DN11855_c1_g1~~TRINITY_DN11855_c1_g1_i1.p1  ORF type:complete len:404 (+),score=108.69 TRINITY_DN11855_c1_g1_i1:55-1212(+)
MAVVFENISYTVRLENGTDKQLLHNVTGYALPGRMIALMGASGAGKTTLLDVLASRKNSGTESGRILLNGHPKKEETFSRITSYVEQQDLHMPLTTVREALMFSAELRLPASVTLPQKEAFVDEVLQLLELKEIQDVVVGEVGSANGLAPGERKRLTIAVELVSNAPVIFLDEPTSGLDARAAAVVMRVVKNIAMTGRTVICTIHQPSADLFLMFDDLLLLQKGGYMAYFGPIGQNGHLMVDYLQQIPGVPRCPPAMNPASWMLDALSGTNSSQVAAKRMQMNGEEEKEKEAGKETTGTDEKSEVTELLSPSASAPRAKPLNGPMLTEQLKGSPAWASVQNTLGELVQPKPGSKPITFESQRARTWIDQFFLLMGVHLTRIYIYI